MKTTVTIQYVYDANETRASDQHANRCVKADDMASVLWELHHNFSHRFDDEEYDRDTLNAVFSEMAELFNEHGIIPDDLWE